MPTPHVVAKVLLADPAANRWVDQLLAVLNPILRNVAGDLRGPVAAPEVRGWFGLPLGEGMATPAVDQVPKWNGSAWVPGAAGTSGAVTSVGAVAPLSSSGGTTPNISLTGTIGVGNGGTNLTSYAVGDLLVASGTAALSRLAIGAVGTFLRSDGTTASWQPLPTSVSSVSATAPLASSGGTTPTISIAGTPAGGVAYATGTTLAYSAVGTAGLPLLSGGAGAPAFGALDIGTAAVTGILPIARGGTNGTATPTAGAIPYGTGTAYAFSAVGVAGQIATSGGAGAVTWTTPSASTTGAGIGGYRATATTPDTFALTDYVVDVTTTGAFTLNLPTAGAGAGQAAVGRVFVVKNTGGATITVTPAGAQLIDTASTFVVVTQFASFTFVSTGSGWVLV